MISNDLIESLNRRIDILVRENRRLQIELHARDEDAPISYQQQTINIRTTIIQQIEDLIYPWKETLLKEATLSSQILLALPQTITNQSTKAQTADQA